MRHFFRLAVAACLLLVGTLAVADQITGSSTGLSNPNTTLTFDGGPGLGDYVIVTSYFGVNFSGFGWDNSDLGQTGSTGFSGGDLVNGYPAWPTNTTMTIGFNAVVTGAAFAAVNQGSQFTVQAFLGGVQQDSMLVTVAGNPGIGYIGFNNESFDTITITRNGLNDSSAFSIDNLQIIGPINLGVCCSTPAPDTSYGPGTGSGPGTVGTGGGTGIGGDPPSAVPEPASLVLLGTGLCTVAAFLKKRS